MLAIFSAFDVNHTLNVGMLELNLRIQSAHSFERVLSFYCLHAFISIHDQYSRPLSV